MKLSSIIQDIDPLAVRGRVEREINNIVYDSREVGDRDLFICISGFETDGHLYIDQALDRGAVAVVVEEEPARYVPGITYIRVGDSRETMSYLANSFFEYPLEQLDLIGVTGTNGKTTTTYLIKSILEEAGYNTGLIGTIKNIIGNTTVPASRTTPESLDLYRLFYRMVENDIDYVVMEVSSHALDLKRVQGMEFAIAVFTNISQDHLDYHKTFDLYLEAKSQLFSQLADGGRGIVNIDDLHSDYILEACSEEVLGYGIDSEAEFVGDDIRLSATGVDFTVRGQVELGISLHLAGRFNVYNALAAIAAASALGVTPGDIKNGLESIEGVPGRFELIERGQGFAVVVDYAHTPDGMKNVLETASEIVMGKIIVVFGCGGDRDREKRPIMARVAARYGDYSILTSDNPRSEKPIAIIRDIEDGIKELNKNANYTILANRRKAIYKAIKEAKKGDVIIIFGKGHESYQVFADKTIHFDDREVAKEALNFYREGDDM